MRDHPGFEFPSRDPFDIPFENYERTPPDDIFKNVQTTAIELWETYDNTFGYVTEKTSYVSSIENVGSNIHTIVAMFDRVNKVRLWPALAPTTQQYYTNLKERTS